MRRFVSLIILIILIGAPPAVASPVQNDIFYTRDYCLIAGTVEHLHQAAAFAEQSDYESLENMLESGILVVVRAGIRVKVTSRAHYPVLEIVLMRDGTPGTHKLYTGYNMIEHRLPF
jgi:hypothetical protein